MESGTSLLTSRLLDENYHLHSREPKKSLTFEFSGKNVECLVHVDWSQLNDGLFQRLIFFGSISVVPTFFQALAIEYLHQKASFSTRPE